DVTPELPYPVVQFFLAFRPAQTPQALALDENDAVVEDVDPQVRKELLASLRAYGRCILPINFLPVSVPEVVLEEMLDPRGKLGFGSPLQTLQVGALLLEIAQEGGFKLGEGIHSCTLKCSSSATRTRGGAAEGCTLMGLSSSAPAGGAGVWGPGA